MPASALYRYGPYKAKIALDFARTAEAHPRAKLILVTAINPTPAGKGKTTTTIGLGDALKAAGKRVAIALREPSLGPVFGAKGGATGGGHAQIVPMQEINLHFTGDLHAITSAHNLLAAAIDNHIYWGNALDIDVRRISWRRVVDLNDRALRHVTVGLGGVANGFPREDGFDITVASEVMAIFCLARSLDNLEERLGRMVVAQTRSRKSVTASQLNITGAMVALLRDAFQPNLVQSLEGTPALVHGGPFANIAHGCNSVIATRTALGLADFVVTEAGFGADLGAEKFLDIKCRQAGLHPSVVVIVATVRALKMHGGVAQKDLGAENVTAVSSGSANLVRHIENMKAFGVPVVVAINRFTGDTPAEIAAVEAACRRGGRRRASVHALGRRLEGRERARRGRDPPRRAALAPIVRSMPTNCRWCRRSRPLPAASIAPARWRSSLPRWRGSPISRRRASVTCRCAWRRRNSASPPTRPSAARRQASYCRCARCGSPQAPASWWCCAAT